MQTLLGGSEIVEIDRIEEEWWLECWFAIEIGHYSLRIGLTSISLT